jgi:hypothetical protein
VPPAAGAARRLALGALLVAGCVPHQTRRPGSDMVIVRPTFNPVEAIARTQCQRPPVGAGAVVGDSLGRRQPCPVSIGDSVITEPGRPALQQPPQRVP